MKNEKTSRLGFTLIELLVVVLIIGILAAVALPQYQKAVDKARVATMLPLMRHWADALALYKLENGSYLNSLERHPSLDELGISCPSGWDCSDDISGTEMENDLWYCFPNEEFSGYVYCDAKWRNANNTGTLWITQPDEHTSRLPAGKRFCSGDVSFCKLLGGKEIAGWEGYYEF